LKRGGGVVDGMGRLLGAMMEARCMDGGSHRDMGVVFDDCMSKTGLCICWWYLT
jgi:hypothetical protein